MFRTFAVALLAASVLTAPVLAQNATAPASADKSAPAAPAPVKTVKADRAAVKHVRHARHVHGTRFVKHVKHMKYAHHMKRHNVPQTTGAAAPVKPTDTKPAAKSGAN